MLRRGVGSVWWRRWRSVEGAVAQQAARRSHPGDGPVRSAEEALTRGSRRHSGWAVRRLAPGASTRPPSSCSAGDAWCGGVGKEGRGAGGVLVRAGEQDAGDLNRAAPTAMSMPVLACPDHANVGIDIDLLPQGSK